jgi:hypothetical protein
VASTTVAMSTAMLPVTDEVASIERLISFTVAFCSSTAPKTVCWMSLIYAMTSLISEIASTAPTVSL